MTRGIVEKWHNKAYIFPKNIPKYMGYEQKLLKAKTFADIFDIVKSMALDFLGVEQAGLLVGLTDLGSYGGSFVGAFYSLNANAIIINKRHLGSIRQMSPELYNPYLFHVMLHEYIHSLGVYDEIQVRQLVYEISRHFFGENHIATEIASDLDKFLPNLMHPSEEFESSVQGIGIEFLPGIDRKNTNYIN